MPRYFLHIVDHGQLIEDEEGVELESAQDAIDEAEMALRELLGSAIAFNQPLVLDALVVADENGRELRFMPITDALPDRLK